MLTKRILLDAILLGGILAFSVGCKKESNCPPREGEWCDAALVFNHTYDTVYPSEYIAAYPGSWWSFSNGTVETCTSWDEVRIWDKSVTSDQILISEDIKILPKLGFSYIHGDSVIDYKGAYETTGFIRIVGHIPGEIYFGGEYFSAESGSGTSVYTTIEYIDHFDSLDVGNLSFDDVILIRTERESNTHIGTYTEVFNRYYCRGIGLIQRIEKRVGSGLVWDTAYVTDYHIAPH